MRIGFWKSGNFQEDTNGKKHFVPSEDEENHPGAFVSLRSDREGKTPATKQRAYLQYKQVEDFSASNTFRHNLYYLSEDEGIELRYFVEIHEPPVKGKSYKNSARMMDIDMEPRDTTFTVKEDLPSAKDNLYRIKILKTDKADGRPLSGAQFLISKKYSRFEKIIESNSEGIADADNLLPGDYLVREIEPPDGYLARRRNIEVGIEMFNENREVTIPLQNERRNPNTLDIIVEKKWLRLVKPGTPSPATLLPDLSFPGSFLDISLPAEDAVLDSDKTEAEYKEEEEEGEEEKLTQPGSITIYLLKNGERDKTLKAKFPFDTDGVHVFTDLPRRDENGKEIEYSIEELNIPGYSTAIAGSQDTKFTVTNYPNDEGLTAIPVTKIWKGKGPHPKFLEVYLLSKGNIIETVELSAKNDWQHTFIVSKTDSEDNKIEYSIKEKEVEGYNSKTEHNEKTGYINVLINEKPEEEDEPNLPGNNGNTPGNPGGGGGTPPRVVERPPIGVTTPPPSTIETPGEVLGANRTTPSNMTEPSPQVLGVDRAKVLGQGRGWTKTSDSSAVYLYLSFFLLSLTALSFVLIQKKRNKESKR